jgi:hypothetical protein
MVEQITELLNAISKFAWPAVAFFALIKFRRIIAERLGQMRSLKAPGGTELSFAERADTLLIHAGEVADEQDLRVDMHQQILLSRLATEDPRAAVTQGFRMVRNTIARAISRHSMPEGHTTPERINTLIEHGMLKEDVVPLALTLRDLYYDIEDNPDSKVAPTVAVAFVTAALSLSHAIEKETSRPPPRSKT